MAYNFPHRVIEFRYDYLGRRVQKRVLDADQNPAVEISSRRYLYDGWSLIAEFAAPGGASCAALLRSYTWGLDIARSLADAGGVGALLQIADHVTTKTFLPTYDGNGNIVAVLNADTGALAAAYEYSPFGEPLRSQTYDATITDQPFRFSTKFTDVETGLVYFGRRYYSPSQGRFLGRDPIEESGGLNLYGFCGNNAVNRWDHLGQLPSIEEMFATIKAFVGSISALLSGSADLSGDVDPDEYLRRTWDPTDMYTQMFGGDGGDKEIIKMAPVKVTPGVNDSNVAPNNAGRDSVFPFDHITVATVGFVTSLVTPLTASQNTDAFLNWVGLKNTGDLQAAKLTGQMLSVVGAAFGSASSAPAPATVPANGRILTLDPGKYPIPLDTLNRAGVLFEPLPVNRPAAAGNRQSALGGMARIPGFDLDEAPPAMFRNPGDPVIVQPTPPGQNRGAGASLGGQARGVPNGGTVIIVPWPPKG